jgi:membrane protein DedA with SNARE-associated domain
MAERCEFNPKIRKEVEVLEIILALIAIALGIISILSYNFFKEQITEEIVLYGLFGLLFSSFIFEIIPNILNPFLIIIIGMSSGLGVFNTIIYTTIGSFLGSLLAFYVGRRYGWRFVCPLFSEENLSKILDFWSKHGKILVFVSAFTPLPYVPVIFGALGMEWKEFWLWGILVRAASLIIFGILLYLGFW